MINEPKGLGQFDERRRNPEGRRELDQGLDEGVVGVAAAVARQTRGKIQEEVLDESMFQNLEM